MLTDAQIKALQRAQETLTAIQTKLEAEKPSSEYDRGRVVQAIAHAERALFELVNLVETLSEIRQLTEVIDPLPPTFRKRVRRGAISS